MRSRLRVAVALSIAVLTSVLLLGAGELSAPHDAFACAGIPGIGGDWCAPPG
ncbi:MAG TPA: hypothetical protein VOB72_14640 [Candidatus Dormibacteraeota bacterium]|nr:hypothetical protein [Candidatus Dormibacteraeota bacterium]